MKFLLWLVKKTTEATPPPPLQTIKPKPDPEPGPTKSRTDLVEDRRGRSWTFSIDREKNQTEMELCDGGHRDPELTDRDGQAVQERNLNRDKYAKIKYQWATRTNGKYPTAKEISKHLSQGARGYGLRTVEKYVAAINAATPSRQSG